MIATVSLNTTSTKMEGSAGCSSACASTKEQTSTSSHSTEKKSGEDAEDAKNVAPEPVVAYVEAEDPSTEHQLPLQQRSGGCLMTDESETSVVSALTPEGALIRETPPIESASETPPAVSEVLQNVPPVTGSAPVRDSDALVVNGDANDETLITAAVVSPPPPPQMSPRQRRHVSRMIHAACQSVIHVLRADARYVSAARFTEELSVHEIYGQHSLHLALQQVLQQTTMQPYSTHEGHADPYYYLETFCEAVRRQDVSASVTGAVLAALQTLVEHGLLNDRLDQIAMALLHCAFEETTTTTVPLLGSSAEEGSSIVSVQQKEPPQNRRRSSIMMSSPSVGHIPEESRGSSNPEDEQVVLKLLHVCVLVVQTAADTFSSLAPAHITALLETCWHVRHKAVTASPLLKQAAAVAARQIIRLVFSTKHLVTARGLILCKLSNLLVVPVPTPDDAVVMNKTAISKGSHEFAAMHALTLLLTVLEMEDVVLGTKERDVLQVFVARDVTALAIRKTDGAVLQLCLRVVDQLVHRLHLVKLKAELEYFCHAVLLRRLDKDSTASPEEKEIVLDSLVELCYSHGCAPVNLQDLFLNYDCDSVCTNLYEAVVAALAKTARPANWTTPEALDETRKKIASAAPTKETNNLSLSVRCADSTASYVQQSADGSSKGAVAIPSPSNAPAHALTTVIAAPSGKPVQSVTIASHAPVNHLNRLALEGLLSALDLIGQRCHEAELSKSSGGSTVDTTESFCESLSYVGSVDDDHADVFRSGCLGAEALSDDALQARIWATQSLAKVVRVFNNENPDKGEWLKVAVAEGLLESITDNLAVARLLSKAPENLDKQRLGIYLSRGPDTNFPFQASVRNSFAAIQDFAGLAFASALRKFLSKFRLPGEAQCIDRLMETFSKEYFDQQRGCTFFKNADAVYVLAFSTIMLNTDLHNPTIKAARRMTNEQFVKNNRGINGGDDLPDDYISQLYVQIKGRELQVRPGVGHFTKTGKDDFGTSWEGVLQKKEEMTAPVCISDGVRQRGSGEQDKAMFLILANNSVQAVAGVFMTSWDDALVVRTLRGLQQFVKLAAYFELDCVVNDVLQVLLPQGRDYIANCIVQDLSAPLGIDGGASVDTTMLARNISTAESVLSGEDETTVGAENDQLIPFGLLCSSDEGGHVDVAGSASNRGLLALDSSFVLLRKNSTRVKDAWPTFIECLCALRDAHALPAGLLDLDDFADSNGNVLPLSSFARASQKRLDQHHRALADKDTAKQKGWFRSFFRKGKIEDQLECTDDDASSSPKGELSVYAKTLLGVAEAADVENIVQMGSSQLPDDTIRSLLDVLDAYPFENDPAGEQHAVFTLELAARALLSNRVRAEDLFTLFLAKFENILCKVTGVDNVCAPFVIERIVVTILRSSIHLYEYPELRPQLRASLQLLTMTLPRSFVRAISDRMACGLAIILRASFHFFESHKEWTFMGDTLDVLANYSSSRVFVFDGIASTVEYTLPNPDPTDDESMDDDDRPRLSLEACSSLSRILTRFVLGFYQGDLSLTVPAMLCLEKVYRRKTEILLQARTDDDAEVDALDLIASVPDKDLWQNVAVAVYSVCRSADPDASAEGMQCYRRIVLRTSVDQIPDDKWVAIMHLMVNKQPPMIAEVSRGNTFAVLGHLLTRVLPSISRKLDHREDLEELIIQFASLAEENMQSSCRGPLFEKTLQTLTYLSNHMVSDDWEGDKEFSSWASETFLKELEQTSKGGKVVTTANAEEAEDVSEISDSVADDDENE